jgi:translation elongation factor EF-Ts
LEEGKTVEEFVKGYVAKTGENIVVRQFRRVELGVTE